MSSAAEIVPAEIAGLATSHGYVKQLFPMGFTNMFHSLARNIAGQQLAIQAAKKIHGRFLEVCKVRGDVFSNEGQYTRLSKIKIYQRFLASDQSQSSFIIVVIDQMNKKVNIALMR